MAITKETSDLIGQRTLRLQKVQKLKDLGIDPYPSKSKRDHKVIDVISNFDSLENQTVILAGRLMSWREHGHLIFGHIQDQTGEIQLYIKDDEISGTSKANQTVGFKDLNLLDIGDIVETEGVITKTQRGEISILVKNLRILTKAIRPLPTNLDDVEERFRRRYLDMTLHPEVRQRFERRAKFWQATRDFLNQNGFIEVNIPVLEHVTGGADAKPFVTHYDTLDQDFYLRISHELPLKRLIGSGFEKVYDLGPRFRNEGFSDEHLPEHIAMEWYWAYADYKDGMEFTKNLFKYVMQEVYGKLEFEIKGFKVNLNDEWEIIHFADIIRERLKVDIFNDDLQKMNTVLKENGVDLGEETNKNRVVDNLWKVIRKTIAGPAFLIDVPKFLSPLAKSSLEDARLTCRFHPVIAGSELGNAFSELNDPVDQLERFLEQQNLRDSGDDEAHMLDIDFVEMLEYGMAPAVGYGHSERVFWFFENVTAKEGVPFPQLKTSVDENTKKIYPQVKFEEKKSSKPADSKLGAHSSQLLDLVKNIQVVKIIEITKHPNADKLSIVKIDNGNVQKEIVTGASNIRVNDLVPYLGEGNIVPGFLIFNNEEIKLEKKALRGVISEGMILAEDEIGIGHDHEGILILDVHTDSIGKSFLDVITPEQKHALNSNIDKFEQKKSENAAQKSSIEIDPNQEGKLPNRDEALKLLEEHVKDEYQILHSKMVANAMEAWAKKLNSKTGSSELDADLWYITGLLHDIDYYEFPNEHPNKAIEWFTKWGYPGALIHAVKAHKIGDGVIADTKLSAALIACDELSGFLYAYSLMRPQGFDGMDAKGVKKRLKDKHFAAKINREDIAYGLEKFGEDFNQHVELLVQVFKSMSELKK